MSNTYLAVRAAKLAAHWAALATQLRGLAAVQATVKTCYWQGVAHKATLGGRHA